VQVTALTDPDRGALVEMALNTGPEVVARIQGSDVVLTWRHVSAMESYQVWHHSSPYFDLVSPPASVASGLPPTGCTLLGEIITCTLPGGVGDPDMNYFYVTRGIRADGSWADFNRSGEFDFRLTPGG
jgi:hypothetical protein